ncbi:MAG: spore coat protein CotJB [Bacilli bacterium]
MNQNNLFDPNMLMNPNLISRTVPYISNPNKLDLYGPYEGFMKGNLFKNLYNPYKNHQVTRIMPNSEREELLLNIDQLAFAAHDLNLYLDVNPNDGDAIKEFNQYRKMLTEATNTYEKQFGPINLMSDALSNTPWAWTDTPWIFDKEVL